MQIGSDIVREIEYQILHIATAEAPLSTRTERATATVSTLMLAGFAAKTKGPRFRAEGPLRADV
jgi:hypothetical protein